MTKSIDDAPTSVAPWQFDTYVEAEADGAALPHELAILEADRAGWRSTLARLLVESDEHVAAARAIQGEERDQVLADAIADQRRLSDAWTRLTGEQRRGDTRNEPRNQRTKQAGNAGGTRAPKREEAVFEPGIVRLQVSWEPGRIVAWGAGPRTAGASSDELAAMLAAAGAPTTAWTDHAPIALPDGGKADAVAAPVGDVLGWLVAAGAGDVDEDVATSVRWMGRVALWAVELAAHGAMVPLLRQRRRRAGSTSSGNASFSVRWTPALIDRRRLDAVARDMPGSVAVLESNVDARALIRSALTGMVDAIGRSSAAHDRSAGRAAERAHRHRRHRSVPCSSRRQRVRRPGARRRRARVTRRRLGPLRHPHAHTGSRALGRARLGRCVGARRLRANHRRRAHADRARDRERRRGASRPRRRDRAPRTHAARVAASRHHARGHVVLSQDEAWELMAVTGARLSSAGFDVRVPELAARTATPMLRVFAEQSSTAVGASQLADVKWSAVFDDVELTAAEIHQLANQARPMVRSGGRWVAIDRADLAAAAEALAEREHQTQLTGADMLRLALGLEGSPLAGGITVEGGGWAADLLHAASNLSTVSAAAPAEFVGELRSYQADALAWLGFLDSAGIGGCLALDMGLGKTPTMLAHLLASRDAAPDGVAPALVIAPAAVVGNWAAEAVKFAPDLRVIVHHGASRAEHHEIAEEAAGADLVITTYGTAVRDVDAIAAIEWSHVVLDEAQAIKNHTSDTAQQLRRIPARTRVALTGTPIENGLGDLWAILDFTNPGLVGPRPQFIAHLSSDGDGARDAAENALRTLNGILVFRRTKAEPEIAAELPDRIDELDHCVMTPEQIGLYQAVLDELVLAADLPEGAEPREGPDPRRHHRAQADLQPPIRVQPRRPAARRAFGQARSARGDRRSGVRGGGARARVHPLRGVGGAPRRVLERDDRPAHRLLPRRSVAYRPRQDGRRLPVRCWRWRARAVAEGGWHRAQPHRREPRGAVRPVVEPGRRGSSA